MTFHHSLNGINSLRVDFKLISDRNLTSTIILVDYATKGVKRFQMVGHNDS